MKTLFSNDKKKVVLQKVEEEAKEEGLVIPDIFHNVNPESGLPDFLSSPKEAIKAEKEHIEERNLDPEAYDLMHGRRPRTFEVETQTKDVIVIEPREKPVKTDISAQTLKRQSSELSTQTAAVKITEKRQSTESTVQVGRTPDISAASSQTHLVPTNVAGSQTLSTAPALEAAASQTITPPVAEREAQTPVPHVDDSGMQTVHDNVSEADAQTRLSWYSMAESECQSVTDHEEAVTQTFSPDHESSHSQTLETLLEEFSVQAVPVTVDDDLQTDLSWSNVAEKEVQTERLLRSGSTIEKNLKRFENTFQGLKHTTPRATSDDWRVRLKSTVSSYAKFCRYFFVLAIKLLSIWMSQSRELSVVTKLVAFK